MKWPHSRAVLSQLWEHAKQITVGISGHYWKLLPLSRVLKYTCGLWFGAVFSSNFGSDGLVMVKNLTY